MRGYINANTKIKCDNPNNPVILAEETIGNKIAEITPSYIRNNFTDLIGDNCEFPIYVDNNTEKLSLFINTDGLAIDSSGLKANHKYAQTERVVGKWLDGNKVYEKTIKTEINWTNTTTSPTIPHNIAKFKNLVSVEAVIDIYPLPYHVSPTSNTFIKSVDTTNITFVNSVNWSQYTIYITLRYTKTV